MQVPQAAFEEHSSKNMPVKTQVQVARGSNSSVQASTVADMQSFTVLSTPNMDKAVVTDHKDDCSEVW